MDTGIYKWWQTGIVYEIYVRSFMDSNGDGIGDLQGIIQKLDYLQWLGVKALWLTPVYPSPMKDFGYDISDYKNIFPNYGTMEDFDALLAEVHSRNMKLIMDLVPNHTSDQHPWFNESRSSKENAKRNWYIWHDAKEDGSEPNNWLSVFGGSAWQWDKTTEQYYLHSFLKEQPDLNFTNKEVQEAIFDVMRFWLNKGVDGFRVDSMAHLSKDELLRDNPANPDYETSMQKSQQFIQVFSTNQPQVHDVIHKMRNVLDEYDDKVMIGEIYLSASGIVAYYGPDNEGAQLPANFELISTPWKADKIAVVVAKAEATVPPLSWPHWALGNHDKKRLVSRIGKHQAKVAAMLLLTIKGTPTIYYGDEIGMQNVAIPADEMLDPQGLSEPEKNLSRDPQRTPMQWNDENNAGFTTGMPWLRISHDYKDINAETEQNDDQSILMLYKRLIALRTNEPSLTTGEYFPVNAEENLLAYIRQQAEADRFLIVLNTGKTKSYFDNKLKLKGMIEIASTGEGEGEEMNTVSLDAGEGIVVRLRQ